MQVFLDGLRSQDVYSSTPYKVSHGSHTGNSDYSHHDEDLFDSSSAAVREYEDLNESQRAQCAQGKEPLFAIRKRFRSHSSSKSCSLLRSQVNHSPSQGELISEDSLQPMKRKIIDRSHSDFSSLTNDSDYCLSLIPPTPSQYSKDSTMQSSIESLENVTGRKIQSQSSNLDQSDSNINLTPAFDPSQYSVDSTMEHLTHKSSQSLKERRILTPRRLRHKSLPNLKVSLSQSATIPDTDKRNPTSNEDCFDKNQDQV